MFTKISNFKGESSQKTNIDKGLPKKGGLDSLRGMVFLRGIDTLVHTIFMLHVDDEFQTNLVCGNKTLKNSKQEKVLGITINNKFNFTIHLLNITKNANTKFNALTRVQKYMTTDQKNLLISRVASSNSGKIPKIWESFKYLNLRIPEQKSLAETALHIELVNFGKIFLKNVPKIRNSSSLPVFKEKIKKIHLISCSCKYCRK